jgi:hypothetical protein
MGHYTRGHDRDPDSGLFRGRYASEDCLLRRLSDEPLARDGEADRPLDR